MDVSSEGCNHLIHSNKADLISSAEDLIEAMQWTKRTEQPAAVQTQMVGLMDVQPEQQEILQKLQEAEDGMHINLLVMETNRPYADVSSDLMELELQGLVRSLPGGIYRFVR